MNEEEKKTEQSAEKESSENGDKNKDIEVNKDQEENKGILNKCDVLVIGASADDNSMEGYTNHAEVENSQGKNKADVRY